MDFIKTKLKKYLLINKYKVHNNMYNNTVFCKQSITISFYDDKIEMKDISNNRKFDFDYENLSMIKKFIKYLEKNLIVV
jgi:hypothetical protein